MVTPCRPTSLTTTLILGDETKHPEEIVMMNWTEESVRAEAEYRRQQLHKLAGRRRSVEGRRSGAWNRWMPRGTRH